MNGTDLLATVLVVPPAVSPLLLAAFWLVVATSGLTWVRHPERSLLSVAAIALGFGFAGLLALMIGVNYLGAVLPIPYPSSVHLGLGILFVCTQTCLTLKWVRSPPKRWRP